MKKKELDNLAFIDGQNLYFGTTKCTDCAESRGVLLPEMNLSDCICGNAWSVNLRRLRIYLKDKYNVRDAYYFLGYLEEKNDDLYRNIQKAGFIVIFKEHHAKAKSSKKGNVDTDLVFEVMKSLLEEDFDKIILISGDGDYNKLVSFLVKKGRFLKILFPNKKFASSLYKSLGSEYFDYLENIKSTIGIKEKGS